MRFPSALLSVATLSLFNCGHASVLVNNERAATHGQQQPLLHSKIPTGPSRLKESDLVELHRNLIEIESISANEYNVGEWLEASLKDQGYRVERQQVAKSFNVLAWPGDKRNPRLLITSHIDTVPPYISYKLTTNETDTLISGRGSVDAKASVAAMIIAANSLLDSVEITPNDFALLFVVGEETSGTGMDAANSLGLTPKRVIFGEPTEGKLASGHKGIVTFNLEAHGKAAHSGYPWLGRSANTIMVKALTALLDLEKELPSSDRFGVSTLNIGTIQGGVASNVVAESAKAGLSIRIAKGTPQEMQQKVRETVEAATAEFKQSSDDKVVTVGFVFEGYGPVPLDTDIPGFENMAVNYGTDVPNFNVTVEGQKRYLYGPGSILVAHSDHEAILLSDLEKAVEDYKKIILHCLQT